MAYSPEQWERAKILFELEIPLSEIEEKTGISKGQISKKSNKEKWGKETKRKRIKADIVAFEKKKETLEKENETLIREISTLDEFEITIIQNVVEEETRNKSLLFSTANLSLIRKNQLLTKNKKQVIEMETHYSDDGKPLKKTPIVIEMELSPTDLKTIDEGVDKNAVTMEIAQRHSNTTINNTNATQNNYSPQEISQAIADGLPD
jgi:hypothetical protein